MLTTVSANDVDTNPALKYSFADEDMDDTFAIDRFSGRVVLKRPLDYETKQEYGVKISVSDTAHIAYTTLSIRVTDVNDNPPVFQQPAYHVTLPGKFILQIVTRDWYFEISFFFLDKISSYDMDLLTVNASDVDTEANAKVRYSIVTPVEGFTIGEMSGVLYVNTSRIARPLTKDIQLTIMASDSGTPTLTSIAAVRVHVSTNGFRKPQLQQNQFR